MPPMERTVAAVAALSLTLTFVFGMSVASILPRPVPGELKWLFAIASVTTIAAGLFFIAFDRLGRTARLLLFLFIGAGYIGLMLLAH